MTRRFRRFAKALAAATVLVLFAVGCSSDGHPVSYDDQIDAETGLSNVEQNWLEGCPPSLSEEFADEAATICECSFADIRANIPFEDFVAVNGRFEDNPKILGELAADNNATARQVVDIVKNCIDRS